MAKHSNRGLNGRFAKMGDSIEHIDDVSAEDVRPGMARPRHAPSGDNLDGPAGGPRHVVLLDADTGQHLGTVTEDSLRPLIGRRSGHLSGHLIAGEHDALSYITSGE